MNLKEQMLYWSGDITREERLVENVLNESMQDFKNKVTSFIDKKMAETKFTREGLKKLAQSISTGGLSGLGLGLISSIVYAVASGSANEVLGITGTLGALGAGVGAVHNFKEQIKTAVLKAKAGLKAAGNAVKDDVKAGFEADKKKKSQQEKNVY